MKNLICCAVLAAAGANALAESIASSAASSASITASSASESLDASSDSSDSSKRNNNSNTARAGDYRIEAVTAAAQPGKLRLMLRPLEPTAERQGFVLTLPRAALEPQGLARGDMVSVRERAYGFEFAHGDTKQAFFLVLADAWQRELDPRPVVAAPTSL